MCPNTLTTGVGSDTPGPGSETPLHYAASSDDVDVAAALVDRGVWHACAAGERRAAERLLGAGADLNWEPDYAQGTALDAADGLSTRQNNVIEWLQSIGAGAARAPE